MKESYPSFSRWGELARGFGYLTQFTQVMRAVPRSHSDPCDLEPESIHLPLLFLISIRAVGAAPAQGSTADHIKCQGKAGVAS